MALVALAVTCNLTAGPVPPALGEVLLKRAERELGLIVRFSGATTLPSCAVPNRAACTGRPQPLSELPPLVQALHRVTVAQSLEPESLRSQALWALLRHQTPEARDRVVALLALALDLDPQPTRRNDLAAALLLRGSLDRRPSDLVEALDLAHQAADVSPEAAFNRALALTQLALHDAAGEQWRAIAERPGGAGWARVAALARDRQAPIEPPAATLDALPLRQDGERRLGAWALAVANGAAADEVAKALALASAAATRHASATGDRMLVEAAAAITVADAQQRELLAGGHLAYARARGEALYARCGPELDRAARLLTAAGSPFAGWPRVDQAICAFYAKQFPLADERLAEALAVARGGDYPSLAGRVHWISGLVRTVQGRHTAGERALGEAIDAFAAIREPTHVDYLHALLAQNLDNMGDRSRAWQHRLSALARRKHLSAERTFTVLDHAASAAKAAGWRHAARYFLDEQVRAAEAAAAERIESADIASMARLQRGTLRREMGQAAAATIDLEHARGWWQRLPVDWPTYERLERELAVEAALLAAPSQPDPAPAVAAIDAAIALLSGDGPDGDQIETLRLLRLRAAEQRRVGAWAEAESNLRRALAMVEAQRLGLPARAERARFAAQAAGVGRELLDLLLETARTGDALRLVEEVSNRSWRDLSAGRASRDTATLRAPANTLLLRYAVLPDRLVIWSLGAAGLLRFDVHVTETRLRRILELCREEVLAGSTDGPSCARTADLLLPASLAELLPQGHLGIVADELTRSVPFAALRRQPHAPHLVELYTTSFLPSLLYPPRAPSATTASTTGLFVVDPSFPAKNFPALGRLDGAHSALPGLLANYPGAMVLTGRGATRSRVLDALPGARFVQFEAHGIQLEDGGPVGLLLADDDGSSASLLAPADLASLPLGSLELAVLAACSTGPTPFPGASELDGLPLALLAAGSREVIATGWPIEDDTTAVLLADFHRCWAQRPSAASCLREAQLAFLQSRDPRRTDPRTWAAFQIWAAAWNPQAVSVYKPEARPSTVSSSPGQRRKEQS